MKIRATAIAVLATALSVVGGAAYANNSDPGFSGVDTSFHNKHLYDGGDPTKAKDHSCEGRIAGPYPSGNYVIAKYRVECVDSSYLINNEYVARLKNLDAGYGASISTSNARCLPSKSTKRIDGAGVAWWGCTYKLTVTDKAPAKAQSWQANLADTDAVLGPDGGSVYFNSVITYCHNHVSWCNSHPSIPAIQYWVG